MLETQSVNYIPTERSQDGLIKEKKSDLHQISEHVYPY